MIITQQEFYNEFEKICKMSLTHSTCKLAIFVSCFNIDAICSSKMISEYLKKQFIVFQLIPVVGYIDMKEKYLKLDFDINNILLIGCGATADLESFLDININEFLDPLMNLNEVEKLIGLKRLKDIKLTRKIYVIDGQRPWNLDNLYGSPMICCLDDNSTIELDTEEEAFYYLINLPDDFENEVESSESDEEIEELATDDDNDDDDDEEEEDLDLEDSLDRKRRRKEPKESKRKKQRRLINEYQEVLESYYQQGSTISIPSSHQIYDLLSTIGEINIDYLWLAIIGARSLRDIYKRVYDLVVPGLKSEVKRLQIDEFDNNNNSSNGYDNNDNDNKSKKSLLDFNISKKADNISLQSCKEYLLFLLHHWTLYDSFFYSSYINSKCHLYTNDGPRLLKTIFARMGIPLTQANQNWHYLDLELKKKLDDLIIRETKKLNLKEIIIDGFKRNYGFHGSISSGDYVDSVQALLEYGLNEEENLFKSKKKSKKRNEEINGNEGNEENGDDNDNDDDDDNDNENNKQTELRDKNEQFLKSFWRAYDSLNNYNEIIKGMEIAKFQQQFIFEKGSEIIQKGMIKTQSKFRVVILNESFTMNSSITRSNLNDSTFNKSLSSLKDDRVVDITTFGNGSLMFQNPLILTKLGNWILNVQADLDEGLLPLLIGAYNSDTNTYLICGLPSRAVYDDFDEDEGNNSNSKNKKKDTNSNKVNKQKIILNAFSVLFEKVTQEINIQARMDSFQSAIIELKKEDLGKFLDGLTRYSQYML
jgi:cell division control protein 45